MNGKIPPSAVPPEERRTLLNELFGELDDGKMGKAFAEARESGDEKSLIAAAAAHFRARPPRACGGWEEIPPSRETADRAVRGDVTVVEIPWQFPHGRIDWHFNPTLEHGPCNHEWLWQLNRMEFWRDMAGACRETGNEKYAEAFDAQLAGWLAAAGSPPEENWNVPGSVWRTIETGLRMMDSWPAAFETFRTKKAFTDESICLMLGSMLRHARHLRAHHKVRNNWLLMEMTGLYTFGVLFPEFACADAMRRYAAEKFGEAVMVQILPDGMHDELSPDYHEVLLGCVRTFFRTGGAEACRRELPPGFMEKLEKSYEAILQMATPGLTSPRTNDCYTCCVDKRMARALELFPDRKDFLWAASGRKEGTPPASEPSASRLLPWAGFACMRSGWGPDALYCCFDGGPLGMGHMHQDKLNINIWKGDEELLFDDGAGHYENSPYRAYGVSAADHNTCLVDGLLQRRTAPRKLEEPADLRWISNAEFDYARAVYDGEFGPLVLTEKDAAVPLTTPAVHTREVRFFKPAFFCVQDSLESRDGKAHSYELLFHLDTLKLQQVRVPDLPGGWLTDYGRKYDLLILPLETEGLEAGILQGEDTPPMGGWFIGRKELTRHKCSTLTMTVQRKRKHVFRTLLFPIVRGEALPVVSRKKSGIVEVTFEGRSYTVPPDLEKP